MDDMWDNWADMDCPLSSFLDVHGHKYTLEELEIFCHGLIYHSNKRVVRVYLDKRQKEELINLWIK